MDFLNAFLTIVLVLVSLLMILVVLMQRGNANGGLGSAMGGGMAESALGAETSSVLTRWTRNISIVFFVMVFGLYLGRLWVHEQNQTASEGGLPEIEAPAATDSSATNALQELISQSEEAAEDAEAETQAAADEAAETAQEQTPTE